MNNRKFINIREFCQQLGISESTFRRRKKEKGVVLGHRLLSPQEQDVLADKLGFFDLNDDSQLAEK